MSKTKVLFMTPPAPKQTPFSTFEKRPPLGIASMMGILNNAGIDVALMDNYLGTHPALRSMAYMNNMFTSEQTPDYVGIYTNTICMRGVKHILNMLWYLRTTGAWKGQVMVGGPHASLRPSDLVHGVVDYIVEGEGENVIQNIVEGNCVRGVMRGTPVHDMDSLPFIPWHMLVDSPYDFTMPWSQTKPVFTMNTSRGCPYSCSFCSVQGIWGHTYRYMSANRVLDELSFIVQQYGAKGVYFREDNFFVRKHRVAEFAEGLLQRGLNIEWAAEARADNVNDKELMQLCARSGLKCVYMGVESGSDEMLAKLNKKLTTQTIRDANAILKETGIGLAASVMVGLPDETPMDIEATRRFVKELSPMTTWWNVFVGMPGSPIYDRMLHNTLYKFRDDRGLLYGFKHDELCKEYYGDRWDCFIPFDRYRPRISVCIPAYNAERTLKSAVYSIINQTEQNIEVLIVNDASTDGTGAVAEELAQEVAFRGGNLQVIHLTENVGNGEARNIAIRRARGKYIAQMDADDISLPCRLERQADFLDAHSECVMVGAQFYLKTPGIAVSPIYVPPNDTDIREWMKQQNPFAHGTVMVRSDVLRDNMYDASLPAAADYELWSRLAQIGSMANLAAPPEYEWHDNLHNVTNREPSKQNEVANMVRERIAKINLHVPDFSVIIPTCNRPVFLARAINSVLSQTHQNFEIIVVEDDPNAESMAEVMDRDYSINDHRISFCKHVHTKGLAAARNTGLSIAKGMYVCFLDDDDYFWRGHFATHFRVLNVETPITYSDMAYMLESIDNEGKIVQHGSQLKFCSDFDRLLLIVHNLFPVNAVVVNRLLLNSVGVFDETLTTHEDWDMWIRLADRANFKRIKLITGVVSERDDTMTATKKEDFYKTMLIIHNRYNRYYASLPHIVQRVKARHEEEKGFSGG